MIFQFNEHRVCVNPIKITIFEKGLICVKIRLAEKDNKWYYGYDVKGDTGGCCGSPKLEYSDSFDSREDCEYAATIFTLEYCKRNKIKKLIGPINIHLSSISQLSLF